MRTLTQFAMALLVLTLLGGCGGSPEPVEEKVEPEDQARWTIAFSQSNTDEPWRVQMGKDIEAAAGRHDDVKLLTADAKGNAVLQQEQFRSFVDGQVDLIIVSPSEAVPMTEPVGEAIDADIPVIVLDRPIIGNKYTCFIAPDDEALGRTAGEWLREQLGGEGNIVELEGNMSSRRATKRHEGFRDALRAADVDVLYTADMGWSEANAEKAMREALGQYQDIDAVFAHNDAGARGASKAAVEAGRREGTLFIGIGALAGEGLDDLNKGLIDASVEFPTGGEEAIDAALKILGGQDVPSQIRIPGELYTAEDVAAEK